MRRTAAALAVSSVWLALVTGATAAAEPAEPVAEGASGHYVDRVEWAKWGDKLSSDLSSLRVYPTPAARSAAIQLGTIAQADVAWAEVLTRSPRADTPGMRDQFLCHWQLAEFAQPGKISWNLEPWRPEVDYVVMLETGCNPGAAEEPF